MFVMVAAMACAASAADLDVGGAAEVRRTIDAYNQSAVFPIPQLDAKQAERLFEGEVVRILFQSDDPDAPSAAVAMALSPVSRDALWIAAQDPHTQVDPGLTEHIIRSYSPDHALWYGYWDLPRPVRDRHWVVESHNNHDLAASLDGRAWEHAWRLEASALDEARASIARGEIGSLTLDQVQSAIFTPVNRGAWFMFRLADGQTLFGYQATSVVGGAVPTWLVTRLVMARLESTLRSLETRARTWSPTHYVAGHAPVPGGDGQPIAHFSETPVPPRMP